MLKKIIIALIAIFIGIQFFRPAKNKAAGTQANSIDNVFPVPENVKVILNKSCMDCHSNNTHYPWYDNIQPVSWWLDNHVKEGKREINFDEYATYNLRRKYHKMEEVVEQMKSGEMPLKSYTVTHADARLNQQEKQLLIDWAESVMNDMKARYPADSLMKKK